MEVKGEKSQLASFLMHEIQKKFTPNIVALFWIKKDKTIGAYEGTGFLIKIVNDYFCITAKHVIDEILKKGDLYILTDIFINREGVAVDEGLDIAFFQVPEKAVIGLHPRDWTHVLE